MSESLKRRNDYERPDDVWRGQLRASDEMATCTGPSPKGQCCQQPARCVPVRSVRSRRGIFVTACTALIIGCVLVYGSGPDRNQFFAPGPLTSHHAPILADAESDGCAACHSAGNRSLVEWISDAIVSGRHVSIDQSMKCMDCHNETICSENSLLAHNVDPQVLKDMTLDAATNESFLVRLGSIEDADGRIACAACHREHHGSQIDLSQMTDHQCQTCHVQQFHSFETNHPEFTNWPFEGRRHLTFDHNTHALKHFPEQHADFNCSQCHMEDSTGNVLQLAPYQESCASCHDEQIVGSPGELQPPSIRFFQLPMIDVSALTQSGMSIGQWPEHATGDFDGVVPPVMQMLLSADQEIAELFEERGRPFDFAELDGDDPADIQIAHKVAWAIKALLHDLSGQGKLAIKHRIESVTQRRWSDDDMATMLDGLHSSLFSQAQQEWMPELASEMAGRRLGIQPAHVWIPSDRDLSGRRRLQDDDLLAANPLKHLLQPSRRSEDVNNEPPAQDDERPAQPAPHIRTADDNSPGQDRKIVNPNYSTPQDESATANVSPPSTGSGDSVTLADNPLTPILSDPSSSIEVDPKTLQDPVVSQGSSSETANPNDQQESVEDDLRRTLLAIANNEYSPWQIDHSVLAIDYRLRGHADLVMQSWIDWSAIDYSDRRRSWRENLFQAFHGDLAAGGCRNCHAALTPPKPPGKIATADLVVQWRARYRDPNIRSFTNFSHRPHLVSGSNAECASCHELSRKSEVVSKPGDFVAIKKSQCSSCHRRGGADASCTGCHNYHVGSRVSRGQR